jgi:hypothetical protein
MAFSILEHLAKLEPSDHAGKYICPACGGNDLSVNEGNGAYNCFNDDSPKHRAEIRNILAPLERWERPMREARRYSFPYQNRNREDVIIVTRDDSSGKKSISQDYPTANNANGKRSEIVKQLRKNILPYRYYDAIEASAASGLPIFIVEGELTADRLWEIGLPSSTFLGGSGQYRANGDYSQLFRGQKVVLCPDRDEPGVALMKEVAADNPNAQWCYAEPSSFEWDNLPQKGGYDLADWLDDGADQDAILSSIVSKDRHEGKDGLPSYEEIIGTFERMVGLYNNDARIAYEARQWMDAHGVKLNAQEIDKLLSEARGRVHGKEEMEILDAKAIAQSEDSRKWTIAGILPESSVMLLAAAPGSGKSTIVYNWALHVATGKDWSNRRCKKGKVLIIQCDEPVVDAAEKLQIIGYDDDALSNGQIDFIDRWRFSNIPQLLSYVQRHQPQLIMIDSLTSCLAGMDVDLIRSDAGNCIYELRDIANQYGCSIVILHHLNKSGGIRDSSSFEANVSEVVKLYRTDNNPDSTQFMFEWTKSRSGLAGKHFMQRDPATYGWYYKGPAVGGNESMDNLVNMLNSRKHERFDRKSAAHAAGAWDDVSIGRLLEVARRQGLIDTSFIVGPNGERTRMYQSWAYEAPDIDFQATPTFTKVENQANENIPEQEEAPQNEPVSAAANENLPEGEDDDEWF